MNEKAIAALQKAEKTNAWRRIGAYVILPPEQDMPYHNLKSKIGKVKILYPANGDGKLQVFLWDCIGSGLQHGWASGMGYDKIMEAMDGMQFDGIALHDDGPTWDYQLRELGYTVICAF